MSSGNDNSEVTALLGRLRTGDRGAADALLPLIYEQLRGIARGQMARERAGHTLQATVLANEAFVKLMGQGRADWQSRAHFLSVAALAMRRILINHANAKLADKRGQGGPMATFDEQGLGQQMRAREVIALDEALDRLTELSPRQAKVVTYKFYAGLTYEEIAEVMEISVPTVRRDWRFAKAWLSRELSPDAPG